LIIRRRKVYKRGENQKKGAKVGTFLKILYIIQIIDYIKSGPDIRIKPHHNSALGQPLCKADGASKRRDPLNLRHRAGGKRHTNTMVMMFVGGVVLVLDRIRLLFLPYKPTGREFLFNEDAQ
jgi:hypothetical protein